MRISVLGATGMAGSAIVTEALTRGHTVTAWSRTPGRFPVRERLTAGSIDISASELLDPVLTDVDAAILTVRPAPGRERQLAPWTTGFLNAAARTSTRVIVIGGAACLLSPHHPDRLVIDDPAYTPAAWRGIAQASLDQFRACGNHPYTGWTYLSPPAILEPGPRTGSYQRGTTRLLVDAEGISRISAADLAIAVIDEVESPKRDTHFTVAGQSPGAVRRDCKKKGV